SPPSYSANKFPTVFFSIYPAVSPPLGVRWEPDATLRFAPLTQHVLPQTPALLKESKGAGFSPPLYSANKFPTVFFQITLR
ncbi:MAG: hypothetical protein RR373_03165, partial [Akkermansia sp.]